MRKIYVVFEAEIPNNFAVQGVYSTEILAEAGVEKGGPYTYWKEYEVEDGTEEDKTARKANTEISSYSKSKL